MTQLLSKISIVGGSGFLGTNLCRKLSERQIPFEIVDIKKSKEFANEWKAGDVRDFDSLTAAITGNVVINLAAVHRDDVRDKNEYFRTNVLGAENIARACDFLDIRKIIFTSSVAVYGFAEPGTGEDGKIRPFNDYGKTKYLAEEKFRTWQAEGNRCLTIIRPTVIFGEGNRGNVFNLLNQIATGSFVMIGSGTNKKSMAYVENVVAFLEHCIELKAPNITVNYVDTPDMDMNSLVKLVRRTLKNKNNVGTRVPRWVGMLLGYLADAIALVSGKKLPISSIRIKKFCSSTSFTSSKEKIEGFRAPFSLENGIHRTLESEFVSPDPARQIFFTE